MRAVIDEDNNHILFINENNLYHRVSGPAVIYVNGSRYWYKNHKSHRDDGPAIVLNTGNILNWCVNDNNITTKVKNWMLANKINYPFSKEHLEKFRKRFVK